MTSYTLLFWSGASVISAERDCDNFQICPQIHFPHQNLESISYPLRLAGLSDSFPAHRCGRDGADCPGLGRGRSVACSRLPLLGCQPAMKILKQPWGEVQVTRSGGFLPRQHKVTAHVSKPSGGPPPAPVEPSDGCSPSCNVD